MVEKDKPRKPGPRPGMTPEERTDETIRMLRMRQMGASYDAIANHFQLNTKTVWQRISHYLKDLPRDEAATLRMIESRRYDEYEQRLQDGIKQGDPRAIGTAIRLSERRCRLLGLDMPIRHEVQADMETTAIAGQVVDALSRLANLEAAAEEEGGEES